MVTVEVEGINDLVARFESIRKGTADLRQLGTWDWVQSEFYKVMKEQFAGEGVGKSGKWKALSPKYKEAKLKKYGPMPINQRSTATYKSMIGGFGSHTVKRPQEMEIGSTLPTAGWAHRGGKNRPARPIIDFSPEQEERLVEPIRKKLLQLLQNARLRDTRGF